jgi:pseudouridine-5'-phosphate glycosidase
MDPSEYIFTSPEISRAIKNKAPVVALESTVITHGLPYPQNIQLARDMEAAVRRGGASPATIAVVDGKIRVGLTNEELARLAQSKSNMKVGRRDFATAILKKCSGGTTVAATLTAASQAGIRVFATGGIGGVHRENTFDVSGDLRALASIAMVVVCAGAKAILDLPATLEYLETSGVPVVGYKTAEFPAFYSRTSGLETTLQLDSPRAIAEFAWAHWSLRLATAVLVTNPIPEMDAIPRSEIEPIIARASKEAHDKNVHGPALTPFLLQRVSDLTSKRSLRANLSLLLNNALLAAQIAVAVSSSQK